MGDFPQIPGYEIQSELGRGGMAIVYSAIESNLDRPVAIKVVAARSREQDDHIERLENEARGLAALHHPHIVDLYKFGRTADGALFYVMPLLPGGSLEDTPRPMPEQRVLALLDPLLDALGHAHSLDIIHRDIKPANILFDRHGRPLLADFGAAFMRRRDSRLTSQGEAIGSSGYMSPEQARGQGVDARSDLYSTAILAFELLTGSRPFEGPDDLATAIAQTEQPVPRLPEGLRHWQSFFHRALAVNPEHRYPSATAMRAALRALPAKPAARKGWRTGLAIALGVVLLVAAGLGIRHWRSGPAPATAIVAPTRTPPKDVQPAAGPTKSPASSMVAVGERFTNADGVAFVLLRKPEGSRRGLAAMAAPVDTQLYQRYIKDRGRRAVSCKGAPVPAQGCLDLATATDLSRWLSSRSGLRYHVPKKEELAAAIPHVAAVPASAWTDTCNNVRHAVKRGVVKRSWSGVRKLFGKPKPPTYVTRCEGHYALALDGKGKAASVHTAATPKTLVLLLLDVENSIANGGSK